MSQSAPKILIGGFIIMSAASLLVLGKWISLALPFMALLTMAVVTFAGARAFYPFVDAWKLGSSKVAYYALNVLLYVEVSLLLNSSVTAFYEPAWGMLILAPLLGYMAVLGLKVRQSSSEPGRR
ncbi:hypothetical protein [Terrihabitans rhizophilus]|uniref:Uncharacterized protein n=1 Tax=Terrihabitans rhizophilus TaxID=3092662 RepID=A0ABU4RQN0_9HYPH|nr:hypothetical protein [Terrihabitans sp. PJ23]MDX6807155.1 hypothetical protein [Terrihabitans sp. PJ23]